MNRCVHSVTPVTLLAILLLAFGPLASAQKQYGPGVSDTDIKVGNIMSYSGPASPYGTIGRAEEAYITMVNDHGGVNGRKIIFISYDDGYQPPKALEQARRLVESDNVLLVFSPLGTPTNSAIQQYLNLKKVPQLFVASGATKWGNYKDFPWTIGWPPTYQSEARIFASYILQNHANGKIGILYQNDDFGRDYLKGLRDGLGDKASSMIVREVSYEATDPTITSQIVQLHESSADIFVDFAAAKFAAQAIRNVAELGWKPIQLLTSLSISISSVLKPAGLENAKDILSTAYLKDPTDPQWDDDPAMKDWLAFMGKYYPKGDKDDVNNVYGYSAAQGLIQVLRECGDDLTRENVMRQATHLDFEIKTFLPGIRVRTHPTDYYPLKQLQMQRFNGVAWQRFGPIMSGQPNG